MDIQRAIASILGSLDDKIELNRRTCETLEEMARAIFKSWFVDFDPVRAKMAGEKPVSICARLGLTREILDLFPNKLVDSELREIPEGWVEGTLANMTVLNPEAWTIGTRPDEINYVDLSNTKRGRIEVVKPYAAADAPSRAQRVLRPGDTIIGTVRPGNGSYALISDEGLTGSTGFALLRPRSANYTEYVYIAATCRENIESLAHLADGGAYPAVSPEVVAATPCVTPNDKVLGAFSRLTRALFANIAYNECNSRTLVSLRDALLFRLISGELSVYQFECVLEAAE